MKKQILLSVLLLSLAFLLLSCAGGTGSESVTESVTESTSSTATESESETADIWTWTPEHIRFEEVSGLSIPEDTRDLRGTQVSEEFPQVEWKGAIRTVEDATELGLAMRPERKKPPYERYSFEFMGGAYDPETNLWKLVYSVMNAELFDGFSRYEYYLDGNTGELLAYWPVTPIE